ncbi:MAG TPA: GWxTD domain-containing protein [Bacteroidia bacterium]|jgi:GWxTD domain-containing protein|nr:GWxTD domain-containing protein [Bacteroidia bacterium]
MKRLNIVRIIVLFLLFIGFYACVTTNKVSVQNLSESYRSDIHYLHPEFTVYHVDDSISMLYFKIDESELLYVRRAMQDTFYASVRVLCKVMASYDSPFIIDSNSTILKFPSAANTKKELAVGVIPIRMKAGQSYLLNISTTDINSKRVENTYITSDKSTNNSDQNFLVRDPNNGYIQFSRMIDSAKTFALLYNHKADRLYVNYYRRTFPIAAPPFAEIEAKPFRYRGDSCYTITADANGVIRINMDKEGFYHIQADTLNRDGLTLYRFAKHYPNIAEAGQMVEPLRYITSNEEYEKMQKADNVKRAVDEFWITAAGGSKDRAKALIRTYYTRVSDANRYFTSYEEGWKTDRGMIFLIYGPPNVIYRSGSTESWTYGEDRNFMSINFTFQKINNPFTQNDYSLQRSAQYRNVWYNAVDIWREGRVY